MELFVTGLMVIDLKHVGTVARLREVLKMSTRISDSWSAQALSTWPGTLLTLARVFLTLAADTDSTRSSGGGGGGGGGSLSALAWHSNSGGMLDKFPDGRMHKFPGILNIHHQANQKSKPIRQQ